MQHWNEINLVTWQKLIKIMPHQMCAVIMAKLNIQMFDLVLFTFSL